MVSKIIKKTPTKTIKDRRSHQRRGRKKSPIKSAAKAASAVVVASINKSIYTCHRRLIKIFSKLTRIGTPRRSPRKHAYQALKKVSDDPENIRRPLFAVKTPLPPLFPPKRRTIFLDLDETLVHSKPDPPPEKYDFVVRPVIDGVKIDFYVLKRPFVDEFLRTLGEKFEIVIFTAGIEEYASLVLDRIDRRAAISHRLYRDSCKEVDGKFVKDLSELGRDLRNAVIVDDNPNSYLFQPENGILIRPFTDDLGDEELRKLIEFFGKSDGFEDMRDVVKEYLNSEGNKKVEI